MLDNPKKIIEIDLHEDEFERLVKEAAQFVEPIRLEKNKVARELTEKRMSNRINNLKFVPRLEAGDAEKLASVLSEHLNLLRSNSKLDAENRLLVTERDSLKAGNEVLRQRISAIEGTYIQKINEIETSLTETKSLLEITTHKYQAASAEMLRQSEAFDETLSSKIKVSQSCLL
jgi:hypothetical protein